MNSVSVHQFSVPANWPSVLAQRKGNNYKLSHLLLVTSFFRDFSSRSMHSLDIKENLFSLVSLDREFIDSCRKLYQKKINLLLPLKEITQIHIKNEIFSRVNFKIFQLPWKSNPLPFLCNKVPRFYTSHYDFLKILNSLCVRKG